MYVEMKLQIPVHIIVRTEIWERALFMEFQAFWGKSGLPTVLE